MNCPFCGGRGIVEFTQRIDATREVHRRRCCESCRRTWRTVEYYAGNEPDVPAVVRDLQLQLAVFIEQLHHIQQRVQAGEWAQPTKEERVHD